MLDSDKTLLYTSGKITEADIKRIERQVPSDWLPGQVIAGLYEVVSVLGEGSFGIVYKVRHLLWNIELAVKCLKNNLSFDETHKKDFIKECQGWVNLGLHPNIVTCYYVRELGDITVIFLELMDGGNLADLIKNKTIKTMAGMVDFAIQCLDGLSFAHGKGIIHRDIKPLNCLLTSDGKLKITDFGIASGLPGNDISAGDSDENEMCKIIGTPAYMPPEQWAGEDIIGPWSDIYSFGIMLYEMLCGKRPFDDGSEPCYVLKARHLTSEPPVNKNIPSSLWNFISKCLAKEPFERYKTADDARCALVDIYKEISGRFYPGNKPQEIDLLPDGLNNRAISMMDLGKFDEALAFWGEARKIAPLHLETNYNISLVLWRSGKIFDTDALSLMKEIRKSHENNPLARYLLALLHLERGVCQSAMKLLKEIKTENLDIEIDKPINYCSSHMNSSSVCVSTLEDVAPLWAAAISNTCRLVIAGGDETKLKLWDVMLGKCIRTYEGHTKWVNAVAFTGDNKFAVTGSGDNTIRLWNILTGDCIRVFQGHYDIVTSIYISPDGNYLLSGSIDGTLKFWNLNTGFCIRTFYGHEDAVKSIVLSNKYALSGGDDFFIRLWDIASGKCIRKFEGHEDFVNSISVSRDGRYMLSGGGGMFLGAKDYSLRLWDMESGKCIRKFDGHKYNVNSVKLSDDGKWALSGSNDTTMKLWDVSSGRCVRTFEGHDNTINSVSFSYDGKMAVSAGSDRKIKIWRLELLTGKKQFFAPLILSKIKPSKEAIMAHEEFTEFIDSAKKSMEEKRYDIALEMISRARNIAGYDSSPIVLDLWNEAGRFFERKSLRDGWYLRSLEGHSKCVNSVAFSPDGLFVLSGSNDNTMKLWSLSTGKCIRTFEGHGNFVNSVAISSNGLMAISGSWDKTVRLWDISSGQCVRIFEGHSDGVSSVAFSKDGKFMLSGSHDMTLRLWEIDTGRCINVLQEDFYGPRSVSLSNDARRAVSGGDDNIIKFWDLFSGRCISYFHGHTDPVWSVALNMDKRIILSGSSDNTLKVWNISAGTCIKTLEGHEKPVYSVALSSDGKWAVSGSEDKTVKIWDINSGTCLRTFEGHSEPLCAVSICNNCRWVASGSRDGMLKVWELEWDFERNSSG